MINMTAVLKLAKSSPLCQHFLETRKNAKQRSTMSWLATCDTDTLYLINQTITKLADDRKSEEVPIENTGADIFDEDDTQQIDFDLNISSDETEEMLDGATEVMCMTAILLFWERNVEELEEDMVISASDALSTMAIIEALRRAGLVRISGSGRFFDPDNAANPIKGAKTKAKALLKKKSAK